MPLSRDRPDNRDRRQAAPLISAFDREQYLITSKRVHLLRFSYYHPARIELGGMVVWVGLVAGGEAGEGPGGLARALSSP